MVGSVGANAIFVFSMNSVFNICKSPGIRAPNVGRTNRPTFQAH